jgi:hypothetical protein
VVPPRQGAAPRVVAAGAAGSARTIQHLHPSTHTVPGQEAVTRFSMVDELLYTGAISGEEEMEQVMTAGMDAIGDALDSCQVRYLLCHSCMHLQHTHCSC